jgi:hypothetical protein
MQQRCLRNLWVVGGGRLYTWSAGAPAKQLPSRVRLAACCMLRCQRLQAFRLRTIGARSFARLIGVVLSRGRVCSSACQRAACVLCRRWQRGRTRSGTLRGCRPARTYHYAVPAGDRHGMHLLRTRASPRTRACAGGRCTARRLRVLLLPPRDPAAPVVPARPPAAGRQSPEHTHPPLRASRERGHQRPAHPQQCQVAGHAQAGARTHVRWPTDSGATQPGATGSAALQLPCSWRTRQAAHQQAQPPPGAGPWRSAAAARPPTTGAAAGRRPPCRAPPPPAAPASASRTAARCWGPGAAAAPRARPPLGPPE